MLFNSIQFLLFFPIVTLVYFIIPQKVRYLWLLAASYFFYMGWNPHYVVLLLFTTAVTYLSGLLIDRVPKSIPEKRIITYKRIIVALSFLSNLGVLFYFKYINSLLRIILLF
jgi:D-alanyl-lipoteichoic acid acyltransferase DltB (MBOAT superfamily)